VTLGDEAAVSGKKATANQPKALAGTQAGKRALRPARSLRVASEIVNSGGLSDDAEAKIRAALFDINV
jgi:hypothetical protein